MFIKTNKLFKEVGQDFMDQINTIALKESPEKGVVLFRTGEPANNFYILQEGRICVCAEDQGYEVSFVHVPGDFFGWSTLLDRPSYSASAECVIPSKIIRIEKKKLDAVLKGDPSSGLIFYKNFAGIIGGRFIESYHVKDWFPSIET